MKQAAITPNHPLQSQAWGEFRKAMGIDVVRVNSWQLTFHKISYTPFTIGYFPKGPKVTKEMLETLEKLGKEKNAIFIQIEPNVLSHLQPVTFDLQPSHHPLFTRYTFILDLTKSEEELLKQMHPKTRYNIRVAQKHGVLISQSNSFDSYLSLTKETLSRQGFYAHNETYHRKMWEIMSKAGIAKLWMAKYQGKILAAWIIFCWKDTIYYPYGASSRENREVMAPNLLLWEICRWGKAHGFQKFDLWGCLGPNPDQRDPWYGFHRFKEGYNPQLVEFVGSYDLVINSFLYQLYKIADKLRWFYLKIRK